MISKETILRTSEGLNPEIFDVHLLDDAWYSPKALTRAVGDPSFEKLPTVACIRIGLLRGILELHPQEDKIKILCYCCFGGDPEQGSVSLEELKNKVVSLSDHYCPPWPG